MLRVIPHSPVLIFVASRQNILLIIPGESRPRRTRLNVALILFSEQKLRAETVSDGH